MTYLHNSSHLLYHITCLTVIKSLNQASDSLGERRPCVHGLLSMALVARIWTTISWPCSSILACPSTCRLICYVTLWPIKKFSAKSCPIAVETLYTYQFTPQPIDCVRFKTEISLNTVDLNKVSGQH